MLSRTQSVVSLVCLVSGGALTLACSAGLSGCSGDSASTPGSSSGGTDDDAGGAGSSGSSGSSGTSGSSGSSGSSGTSGSSGSSGSSGNPATALTPGKTTRTIRAANTDRSVIIVVPSTIAAKPLPLVIALHGNGDTHENFIATSTLASLAESKGFVLAAPQGIKQNVTVGAQTLPNVSWDPYRTIAQGNIDLPLLDAIRTDLVASGSIDPKRLVVFGYSQGGYMSFRYGIDTSATLSCAGLVGAANPLGPSLTASAARKIPFAIQIGTNDGAITQARSTKADLEAKSFPLDYREIQGAGHVPLAGGVQNPLSYCLAQITP